VLLSRIVNVVFFGVLLASCLDVPCCGLASSHYRALGTSWWACFDEQRNIDAMQCCGLASRQGCGRFRSKTSRQQYVKHPQSAPECRKHWAWTNLAPASFAPADLPKHNFVLANPRNFLEVKMQGSGGVDKTVRGFAKTNDACVRFVTIRPCPENTPPSAPK